MSTLNSTLLRSGCQHLRTSRSQPAWILLRQTMPSKSADASRSRFLTTINTSTTASASTSDQHNSITATRSFTGAKPPVASTPLQDAFKHHDILQEAKKRWGFDSPKSTSSGRMVGVIYPKGREEIADLTHRMVQDRVLGGHTGQRQVQEKHSNNAYGTSVTTKAQTTTSQLNKAPVAAISTSPNPHFHKAPRDADRIATEVPLWRKHRQAIKAKTGGQAWNPQRKLTRQAMEEVRYLRKQFPEEWTTAKLADHFNVAGESIAKILRTHYQPTPERSTQQDEVRQRRRKENISADIERIRAERQVTWTAHKTERKTTWLKQKTERRAAQVAEKAELTSHAEGSRHHQLNETMTLDDYERIKNDRHTAWLARQAERKRANAESPIQIKLGAPTRK
ncbi:Required for respiratory growth protein 9 mitochondrial [Linnemannia hyalina]|uniref:Required for respiratory growth protein 9, mitochondrial n=1 Tax=Linnemannia hyalina TaxID=64524 RepID=A0A9P7XK57_9FUNG|nr:Required for respiratory growth protein 9 mitochondrial [Linnemannia hyalina]